MPNFQLPRLQGKKLQLWGRPYPRLQSILEKKYDKRGNKALYAFYACREYVTENDTQYELVIFTKRYKIPKFQLLKLRGIEQQLFDK